MAAPSVTLTPTTGVAINPTLRGLAFFERTQDWQFRLRAWPTPNTALAAGKATEGLQLRVYEPKSGTPWATYTTALRAVAAGANPNTAFTDTTKATSLVQDGRWPVVQTYWGGGTPNWWGGTVPGQVAVSYRGRLVPAARRSWLSTGSQFVFAAAGSGVVRIDVVTAGSRVTVLNWTPLTEGNFLTTGFVMSAAATVTDDSSDVEVFYVQDGTEPWGGLVVKVVPGASATPAQAAAAPALSAGLFSYASLDATDLAFVLSADVTQEVGTAPRLSFQVPLVNPDVFDGNGWVYAREADQTDPGRLDLYTGGTAAAFSLRRKRLVQLEVALKADTPVWYPIFTGHVHDFESGSDGRITVECLGFESRMVEQYDQIPDRISYMSRGFQTTNFFSPTANRKEPVYNIPAFDNWPLAWAVEELGVRAGIDPACFRQPWTELDSNGTPVQITVPWDAAPKRFRSESLTGTLVNLPRPVNYGNAGTAFTETRPFDDEYGFQVEATKDLWARSRELTDKMGYVWYFDAAGAAVLAPANVPTFVHDFVPANATAGTFVTTVNPSAYGAGYVQAASGTLQATVKAARIDLSLPRQANALPWSVSVARSSAPGVAIFQGTVTPSAGISAALASPYLFFNAPTTETGRNSTVATVYSGNYDTYIVTLTATAAAGQVAYADCLLCYAVDPDNSVLPTLSTGDTALSVNTVPQQDATRNKITIVGRRKGTVTDSDKFAEAQAPTEQEFVVANAVDVDSITNPTATNYVGYLKQSVIYDESITDDGFAQYLAQVFIYRQRNPQPGATVQHGMLPIVRLNDPVSVAETRFDTTKAITGQYVRKITHTIGLHKFQTKLDTASWPEYPAYQPRTDINLAAFNNQPVTNLNVTYTTLAGYTITNPVDGTDSSGYTWVNTVADKTQVLYENCALQAGSPPTLVIPGGAPWPPMPGTVQIKPRTVSTLPGTSHTAEATSTLAGWVLMQTAVGSRVNTISLSPDWVPQSVQAVFTVGNITARTWAVPLNTQSAAFYYTISGNTLVIFRGREAIDTDFADTGTLRVTLTYLSTPEEVRNEWLANTPYHQYTDVNYAGSTISLPFAQARGHSRSTYVTSYDVRYRPLGVNPYGLPAGLTTNGQSFSPFYDPYTSELGYVVTTSMDVLASGLYRVSVRSRYDDTIVAWLTNPQAEAEKPEQHWEFLPIGGNKVFAWDGVDQLGEWNAAQSELYEKLVGGAFDNNQPVRVGKGYYCWNREVTGSGLGPLAYIWAATSSGKPVIGHGTYAAWYIAVEAITDTVTTTVKSPGSVLTHLPEPTKAELKVQDYAYATPTAGTGTVQISNGVATFSAAQALTTNHKVIAAGTTFRVVSGSGTSYTVTPNTVTVSAGTGFTVSLGSWSAEVTVANWNALSAPSASTLGATIDTSKPVRIRFRVADRPGPLWAGKREEITVRLTREVHLRSVIGDQVVKFEGRELPGTTLEQRTVYSRRLVNDEHTKQYRDSGFRKAGTLRWTDGDAGVTEWVFYPQDFRSDFRIKGLDESLAFGNYLQLEEVPGWSGNRDIAAPRSRLQFALLSYLFYLSAYVTDRSGRSSWGINRNYVDEAKITTQTTGLDWPDDPVYQQRRSIVCRQWTNEDNWVANQRTAFGASSTSLFAALLQHWWWQHEITATTIGTALTSWSSYGLAQDYYSHAHRDGGVSSLLRLPSQYGASSTTTRQLGKVTGVSGNTTLMENHLWRTTSNTLGTGTWTWEQDPLWIPSITRDLHPYFLLPPMLVPAKDGTTPGFEVAQNARNLYTTTSGSVGKEIQNRSQVKSTRTDAASAETWSSGTFDMSQMRSAPTSPSDNYIRFWPGAAVDDKSGVFKGKFSSGAGQGFGMLYVRQDETVHYEDLRGVYSRKAYPTAQPVKIASSSPYYINQGKYYGVEVGQTLQDSLYPLFHVVENASQADSGLKLEWFRQAFRSEYVWESGSLFPVTLQGAEYLEAALWWRTRYLNAAALANVFYDYGAWAGWKDDLAAGSNVAGGVRLGNGNLSSPFMTRHMPVGVGPVLKTTYELVAHLILLNERRGGA